jgi:hypothetical protein
MALTRRRFLQASVSGLAAAVLALQLQAENIRSPALRIALLRLAPISADLPITGG